MPESTVRTYILFVFDLAGASMSALSSWRPYRFCFDSRLPSFLTFFHEKLCLDFIRRQLAEFAAEVLPELSGMVPKSMSMYAEIFT